MQSDRVNGVSVYGCRVIEYCGRGAQMQSDIVAAEGLAGAEPVT